MSFCHNLLVFIPCVSSCGRIPQAGSSLGALPFTLWAYHSTAVLIQTKVQQKRLTPACGCWCLEMKMEQAFTSATLPDGSWGSPCVRVLLWKFTAPLCQRPYLMSLQTLSRPKWKIKPTISFTALLNTLFHVCTCPKWFMCNAHFSCQISLPIICNNFKLKNCNEGLFNRNLVGRGFAVLKRLLSVNLKLAKHNFNCFLSRNIKKSFLFNLIWCLCKCNKLPKWALTCVGEFPLFTGVPAVTGQDEMLD